MSQSGLYRSTRQHMIAGVMGGIAERFGWNANLLRIIFVFVSVMSAAFPGILVYLILWMVMPKTKLSSITLNNKVILHKTSKQFTKKNHSNLFSYIRDHRIYDHDVWSLIYLYSPNFLKYALVAVKQQSYLHD